MEGGWRFEASRAGMPVLESAALPGGAIPVMNRELEVVAQRRRQRDRKNHITTPTGA